MAQVTVVSAPGKVLVAGGYLVLDPSFSGTVVSTSSRFYTVVQTGTPNRPNVIRVRSPQFLDATWQYTVSLEPTLSVEPFEDNTSKNKFVHLALKSTVALAAEIRGATAVKEALQNGLDITIAGDNDFYSQRAQLAILGLPRTMHSLSQIPPFNPTGVRLSDVHKTGLGSSAALITSLVSALLVHLRAILESSLADDASEGRRLAHNLAQYVHCLAQGKVGSGFDVAAAVFGSHLYTRFEPVVLQSLMQDEITTLKPLLPILTPSNLAWNYRIEPFKLPPLTRIMLADVDAGSDTPSLVGKVLKWRKDKSIEADALWKSLDQFNQSLAQTLLHLSNLYEVNPQAYASAVKYISTLQPVQWEANPQQPPAEMPVISTFYEAHQIAQSIRAKMREMGTLSEVPIEPIEQTKLLDTCVGQAGVIGGGVPGAGGYDAIWLLVLNPISCAPDQTPQQRIEYVWQNYKDLDVSPLSATESLAKGARVEHLDGIPGLKVAIAKT
ncbi:phosphomevalonate kinase [Cyathus striatus]|nr:phosphomevalonate kinase [Cyathus striatus]